MTRRLPAPLPWLAGLLAVYLIAPLVAGVPQIGLVDWKSVDVGALARACAVSISSASLATLIIALGGIPLGYLLARVPGRPIAVLGFLVQLPLALPPLASGILLLFLVGYSAPLGRLTEGALTDSFAGVVLAEVFVAAPFLIISARSAFASMDPALEGVASTLGRRPLEVFFRVSLPIAWPATSSGLLLAWLRAFGEFGATVMVAYHPYSLPVYTYVAFGEQGLPAMLPVLLPTLLLAVVIMAFSAVIATEGSETLSPHTNTLPLATGDSPLRSRALASPVDVTLRLKKRLGGFCLDVAWSPHARRLAILGPSGSGKSLTLKLIAGIEKGDQGVILVGGRDLSQLDAAARAIAYVPQSYGLFPHLTVIEQLQFPVGANPNSVKHWIERLGLRGLEQRRPAALSLGQQQRVALARALMRPASLLLLDEPFSALDAPLRSRLRHELLMLQEELSTTTILVTHDPAEAAMLADELLVIEDGRSLQTGPTGAIFMRPANETVARLLGAENVAEGIAVQKDKIAIGGGVMLKVSGPLLRPDERIGWSILPGRVRIGPAGSYQGVVESVTSGGTEDQIVIRLGNALIRVSDGQADCAPGGLCRLDIDPRSVQIWSLA